jgi:GT2 family glycosyltransferase
MQIIHVHLEQEEPALPRAGECYLVFWWHALAIGQLYINGSELRNNDKELRIKFIACFLPAVTALESSQQMLDELTASFVSRDHQTFARLMNSIYHVRTDFSFPEIARISVIVCTRDRVDDLQVCLKSLQNQKCLPEEIIVVDNGRLNDATRKVVSQFTNARYVAEPTPGLSYARNTGIRAASCPILAWLDDDVEAHEYWLVNIWKAFEDAGTSATTGLVLAAELDTESQKVFEEFWSFNRGFTEKVFGAEHAGLHAPLKVWEIGAGANMAFRKKVFEDIGYFDERLGAGTAGCSEDSELWFRLLIHGAVIKYDPSAVVYHKHRKSMKTLKHQLHHYMRGHVAAALIQHDQFPQAGYRKYVYGDLLIYYGRLLMNGFPSYKSRFSTLLSEVTGIFSGINYYRRNRSVLKTKSVR